MKIKDKETLIVEKISEEARQYLKRLLDNANQAQNTFNLFGAVVKQQYKVGSRDTLNIDTGVITRADRKTNE